VSFPDGPPKADAKGDTATWCPNGDRSIGVDYTPRRFCTNLHKQLICYAWPWGRMSRQIRRFDIGLLYFWKYMAVLVMSPSKNVGLDFMSEPRWPFGFTRLATVLPWLLTFQNGIHGVKEVDPAWLQPYWIQVQSGPKFPGLSLMLFIACVDNP